jgi:2-polyprenyl-6-methoxyphenol hydroxylase-like FAD-dependent oxidoreductase
MNRTSGHAPSDLLVIGGGMAGLTAGAWAARNGARVVLADGTVRRIEARWTPPGRTSAAFTTALTPEDWPRP